jgi:1,4-alpha-glucan branching enzyme
MSILD